MQTTNKFFEDLFVLELANNHWGNLARGLEIVRQFAEVVRAGNVRAAIKLQFRDVDAFVHKDYKTRSDIRYVKKTLDTKLSIEEFKILVDAIKASGCIAMAAAKQRMIRALQMGQQDTRELGRAVLGRALGHVEQDAIN